MQIHELTAIMDELVRSKGWYEPNSPRPQTPRNLAISLSLEASEVLEHFQFKEQPASKQALAGELADVALYLLQLASVSGIDLEQAIMDKVVVNRQREWDKPAGTGVSAS
jgi:NTP pyrophosphatase (non-canonical NTP hydrolase)